MAPRRILAALTSLFLVGALAGCAGLRPVERRWQPYRSAMLNNDFTSAYPRSTRDGQLDVDRSRTERSARAGGTEVARAEPPSAPAGSDGVPASESGRRSSAYRPDSAAAYVAAVYAANRTPATDGPEETPAIVDIYRHTQRVGTIYHSTRPAVGDLVFFHNTCDRNGDGRNNDWYTHVGMVESVDDEGDISILSYLDGRVSRTHLNLERPDVARDSDGRIVNTVMRHRSESDPPYTQYLASELFAGFGSLLGDRNEFLVIDNWQPGMDVASLDQ